MENEDIIKTPEDLAKKLLELIKSGEAFTINATFNSQRGIQSVFFIGGKLGLAMLNSHAESFNAMLETIRGNAVKADSFIRVKGGASYEKKEDGSFKLTFEKNDKGEETPA